jgi:hypothetical protein
LARAFRAATGADSSWSATAIHARALATISVYAGQVGWYLATICCDGHLFLLLNVTAGL